MLSARPLGSPRFGAVYDFILADSPWYRLNDKTRSTLVDYAQAQSKPKPSPKSETRTEPEWLLFHNKTWAANHWLTRIERFFQRKTWTLRVMTDEDAKTYRKQKGPKLSHAPTSVFDIRDVKAILHGKPTRADFAASDLQTVADYLTKSGYSIHRDGFLNQVQSADASWQTGGIICRFTQEELWTNPHRVYHRFHQEVKSELTWSSNNVCYRKEEVELGLYHETLGPATLQSSRYMLVWRPKPVPKRAQIETDKPTPPLPLLKDEKDSGNHAGESG